MPNAADSDLPPDDGFAGPDGERAQEAFDVTDPRIEASINRYWRSNLCIMAVLLLIWAVVGLGCGVLFAEALNAYRLGGFPLGFWFAQQGSIFTFVLLILVYCILLNRLDRKHLREIQALRRGNGAHGNGQEPLR